MSTNTLIVSSIVLMLVLVLSSAQGQHVGERCTIDDYGSSSPGICKGLRDCPVVYNQLLAGISPRKGCGYRGFEPIICCPTEPVTVTEQPTVTQTSQVETSTKRLTFDRNVRGSLARAKCQENAEAVYILETPPTLLLNQPPVNRSLCAVESRKLIVGGKKADPKEFPHMVALGYDGRDKGILWWCGGTLISDKVVLTAAHCLHSEWGGIKWARVGDLNLARTDDEARPQTIKVVQTIQHPDYKPPAEYHDIAILKLQEAVTYDAWVRPACLPVDLPDEGNDNKAVATGWGRQDWSDEEGSDDLMKVTLNLVKHKDCKKVADGSNVSKLPRGVINEWQLCAGELGKDTCQGDSGGPLAIFHKDHYCVYNVIGVTSIGVVCGNFLPGLYTRVYNYIPWIEQNAWPEYF